MAVRLTESRLPDGTSASEFGEAHEAGGYALISYLSSPLHSHVSNDYVVMRVRDDPSIPLVREYSWSLANGSLVDQVTSERGYLRIVPTNVGKIQVVVELRFDAAPPVTLALTQLVDAGYPTLRKNLANTHALDLEYGFFPLTRDMLSQAGDPATTRELIEDLQDYVFRAAELTGPDGVPARMVAAIAYNETLHRPKEADTARPWWSIPGIVTSLESAAVEISTSGLFRTPIEEAIRERELSIAAENLNGGATDGGVSLGVCQMQQQTAAMALGFTTWRQRALGEESPAVDKDRGAAYDALTPAKRVDVYNHLRFPKANIALCAKFLAQIKNRENRWAGVAWNVFAQDADALQIIMHEWNIGPTSSTRADAVSGLKKGYPYPDDYGPRVFKRVFCHPMISMTFNDTISAKFELKKKVGQGGINDPDDVARLKRRLYSLGFDWLSFDKTMDNATIDAIKLFQAIARGHDVVGGAGVDGCVDVPGFTYDWLGAANAPAWTPMPVYIKGINGDGYENYTATQQTDQAYFGTVWLRDFLIEAAAAYQSNYRAANSSAAKMTLNDVSKPQGGNFTPTHNGHQTGLVLDILLPRLDGTAGQITTSDGQYDRAAARALLVAFRGVSPFDFANLNDSVLVGEGLCNSDDPGVHVHDNHIHVEIKPPPRVP